MPRYLLRNVITGECYEVQARYAEEGCRRLGWSPVVCAFVVLRDDGVTIRDEPPLKLGTA